MNKLSRAGAKEVLNPDLPQYESLVHMVKAAANGRPDTIAVIYEDRRITYAEFARATAGLARELAARGVGRDSRVIVMMPNSIEMDVAIFAVMAAGAQAAPANPFFVHRELQKVLSDADAALLLCDPASRDKADKIAAELGIAEVLTLGTGGLELSRWTADASLALDEAAMPQANDPALLIFTGGSTGIPKGVNHTHDGLMWSLLQHASVWPLVNGEERFLNVAPMFHIWGLSYASWVPIYAQSTLVMLPRYEPDKVVRALSDHKITVFSGGPAPIYMGLLASPAFEGADLSQLKYCLSGGAPCPEDLHRVWLARTGCPLLEGWGMTEGAPFCLNRWNGERRLLSVGNPVPQTEVEVVDLGEGNTVLPLGERGEVRVKGPQLMSGYRNKPDETASALRDGWMYTGDIGYIDEDGFLFLVDRKKDMVIVGGYNVYPREIDEVLFNHPKVREAATVGRRDPKLGEVLVAFVVLMAGESMTEDEFFDYCKSQMVKYKRPVEVRFIDALPKTGTNKINRIALRERVTAPG